MMLADSFLAGKRDSGPEPAPRRRTTIAMQTEMPPADVVPLVGLLNAGVPAATITAELAAVWGTPLLSSPTWSFEATRYYEAEMGARLVRSFCAFAPRRPALVDWKHAARRLETRWRLAGQRQVNIDPGYVGLGGLFLASTKGGNHRLYLGAGIYGELTLLFHHGAWHTLPWTFPDFSGGGYTPFLDRCRSLLKNHIRNANR